MSEEIYIESLVEEVADLQERNAKLLKGMEQIRHSMTMALVPRNDVRREIQLTKNIAEHFVGPKS